MAASGCTFDVQCAWIIRGVVPPFFHELPSLIRIQRKDNVFPIFRDNSACNWSLSILRFEYNIQLTISTWHAWMEDAPNISFFSLCAHCALPTSSLGDCLNKALILRYNFPPSGTGLAPLKNSFNLASFIRGKVFVVVHDFWLLWLGSTVWSLNVLSISCIPFHHPSNREERVAIGVIGLLLSDYLPYGC